VALGGVHEQSQLDWEAFLGALGGAPPRVVCDNDHGLTNAVRARFPDAERYLCEWHLRHALERLMGKLHAEDAYRDAIEELLPQVEAAFTGPSFWAAFLKRVPVVFSHSLTRGSGPRWKRPAEIR
jgi:hypothetical protein